MRTYYRERRYICGDYMDVQIYPVYAKAKTRRSKANPTSDVQQRLNVHNSQRKLTRLIHTNFTKKDCALHLTYRDDCLPQTEEEAKRDGQNFLRRIGRVYKALGIEFKYVWVCERGKRSDRIHHHLIISGGVDRDIIETKWQKGYANTKRLQFDEGGIVGLAHYMTKQPLFFKHWSTSRNLKKPDEFTDDYRLSAKKVNELVTYQSPEQFTKLYDGYSLYECNCRANDFNHATYIFAHLYKNYYHHERR